MPPLRRVDPHGTRSISSDSDKDVTGEEGTEGDACDGIMSISIRATMLANERGHMDNVEKHAVNNNAQPQ